ncbi:hypothetical protein GPL21_11575 [Bradyrhizobium pachyrhizi]|uniref:Uncharacterized protein n=1 Tax=Bradyrhizobium pachyrhizi TaxID=280333 RepID=A0A844SIV2_9BRAD|nr:hypothetical protein [Bradyrhizobium pachyrhizi]MVT65747.1 hypothetical protein [Bradyrhizobium pachyrhizi]
MAEKITITVRASGAHPDVLTVQDAMQQVLDFFNLLSAGPKGDQGIEWKLSRATTNSPFEVTGEAVSLEPGVDVSVIARMEKNSVIDGLRTIERGEIPDPNVWGKKRIEIAKHIYHRNLNGIGITRVDFEIGEPIEVTPAFARKAVETLEHKEHLELYDFKRAKEEVGSIEGTFGNLDTYRGRPAISVVDNRTKRVVWCLLNSKLQTELADKARYEDFWKHSRVIVSGVIKYGKNGAIALVEARDVRKIQERKVTLEDIRDRDFTSGLSIGEYLNRLRDGTLG